jgi:hypothetical protein
MLVHTQCQTLGKKAVTVLLSETKTEGIYEIVEQ